MLIDHIGAVLFPSILIFRIIGRISLPLFAFAVSEGCRYTKNRLRHLLFLAGFAAVCQVGYYIFAKDAYFTILVTLTFSVLMINTLDLFKISLFDENATGVLKTVYALLFVASVMFVYFFCHRFKVSYGFFGCLLPVFASIFDLRRTNAPEYIRRIDTLGARILTMSLGLFILTLNQSGGRFVTLHLFAFAAVLILLLYNGERGKLKMKYFFYIFYPAHLIVLKGIEILFFQ